MTVFLTNLLESLEQIWQNKLRSISNILGIIIGIASTILLVAIFSGFSNYVNNFLLSMGTNSIFVIPDRRQEHFNKKVELTQKDINSVLELPIIDKFSLDISRNVRIKYKNKEFTSLITGADTEFQEIRNYYVDVGRFFNSIEVKNKKQVCVLGRDNLEKLNIDENIIGENIYIDKIRFKVIGLLEKKGSFFGQSQDGIILIPGTVIMKLYPFTRYSMSFAVSTKTPEEIVFAKEQITEVLRKKHKSTDDEPNDFRVFTQDAMINEFEKVKWIVSGVLSLICGISLTIGSIGLMNVMFGSISEKTFEIGLRKTVGGTNFDILQLFLFEACVLSVLGGIIGVCFGYLLSWLMNFYPDIMITIFPPIWSVFLGLFVSFVAGILAGILPAWRASKMTPIDCLRRE